MVAGRVALTEGKGREEAVALTNLFANLATKGAKLRVRVDSSTGVAASRTLTITGSSVTAGEYISFSTPGGNFKVTGVASGAVSGDGTFDVSATSNTAATNIRAAINSLPGLKSWVTASGSTNSVVITANAEGTLGNSIRITDGTGGGIGTVGLLTGGLDSTERVWAVVTCVSANTDANDTLQIGKTVLTAKSGDASGSSQFNIGASNAAMGANLSACINANPELAGLASAGDNGSGVVTITYDCDPRVAQHLVLQTSDADGLVITAQPTTTLTLANVQATRTYSLGAP
ncbi:Hypothetical protein I5071_9600 [Sandaracinus amylolyticus]|nr:Hypothetical protein I5071_9600 [Sandaracinus amylolyticus]